ncbi:cationic amino acid transporter 4 [Diprion similis]|uniref:cationic amino acid transporter 4 n=1 Tax=Diprion similis TaxID=362088 RepID=UPI001EF868BD|nr:cationic amino acid transporter 4 [Diprion similis]XP_046750697.1 cationic amino acid transporter 4 [Diprion similis]
MPGVRRMILGHVLSDTCAKMNRMKKIRGNVMETPLKRCLSTFEITLLGIGHMVGAGIYVLTGIVARYIAGPGIVLSFLLAGFASLMAALCYAEFGARVPKAGSAYVYTYVSIGEFWAFIIGWNVMLEHMIGAASVARAWSAYVDSLTGGLLSNYSSHLVCGYRNTDDPPCYDFLAAAVCLLYTIPIAAGVKASAMVNAVLTLVNLVVIIMIGGMGFYYADIDNWVNDVDGFLPFGFNGVLAGAATCFYAFVGFDSIATAGEEAREPARSIPIATIIAMVVVTTAYVVIGGTLTAVVPFREINPTTALLDAFSGVLPWAKYVISIGALCGMTTTLFGSLFSLPRTMYSMASDGLLFGFFAKIFPFTRVPIFSLIFTGLCCSSIAFYFDLEHLVEFMSIGTFLAYTIVSASVIVLRYRPEVTSTSATEAITPSTPGSSMTEGPDSHSGSDCNSIHSSNAELLDLSEGTGRLKPRYSWLAWVLGRFEPGKCVTIATLLFALLCVPMCAALHISFKPSTQLRLGDYFAFVFLGLLLIICLFVIGCHQQTPGLNARFRVPLVPFVPALSIFCNIGLMFHLSSLTWIRFFVWMILGMLVYFLYGIHHSKEATSPNSRSNLMATPEAGRGAKWGATLGQSSDKVPILSYDEASK